MLRFLHAVQRTGQALESPAALQRQGSSDSGKERQTMLYRRSLLSLCLAGSGWVHSAELVSRLTLGAQPTASHEVRSTALSQDGRWLFFASRAASYDITPPEDGTRDPSRLGTYAYDAVSRSLRRLDVHPAQGILPGDCVFRAFSADARHLLMHCNNDAWVDDFPPSESPRTYVPSLVILDRDTDADGVFDEPGTVRASSATRGASGYSAELSANLLLDWPGQSNPRIAMSDDGRWVGIVSRLGPMEAFRRPECPLIENWYLMSHDRDADGDGIFDEPDAVSFTCTGIAVNDPIGVFKFAPRQLTPVSVSSPRRER